MNLKPYACSYNGCEMRFAYRAERDEHEQSVEHFEYVLVSSTLQELLQPGLGASLLFTVFFRVGWPVQGFDCYLCAG